MTLRIKGANRGNHIAFGGMGKTKLGDYNQDQLRKLAILAQQSKDKSIINLFEGELPSLKVLQEGETTFRMEQAGFKKPKVEVPISSMPAAKDAKTLSTGKETKAQENNKP